MIEFTKEEINFMIGELESSYKDVVRRQKKRRELVEEARNNPDKQAYFKKASKNVPLVDAMIHRYEDVLKKLKNMELEAVSEKERGKGTSR